MILHVSGFFVTICFFVVRRSVHLKRTGMFCITCGLLVIISAFVYAMHVDPVNVSFSDLFPVGFVLSCYFYVFEYMDKICPKKIRIKSKER